GAVYLDRKHAFIVPLAAMLISDYFIGFYEGIGWVYGSFAAIGLIGLWLRSHPGVVRTVAATLGGSVLFFIFTNFGVWISSQVSYAHTLSGLWACYIAAIPFFRNTVMGDAVYVAAMFGVYELAKKFLPSLAARSTPASS
ncbi:MAG TPA: DUF6580 family putative transport protein, partial [Bacteroidota bacterium]|nr:DUF6580 family putative transport protein [Bacteroidota bacterium]